MIFLVGARRSGTNWLFQLLTKHPAIVGIPAETYLIALGLAPLAERFHHGSPTSHQTGTMYMDRDAMHDAFRAFADKAFGDLAMRLDPSASRILERTPWNANHLGLIGAMYPDAWVIHIIRDGRDVASSLVSQTWGPATMAEAAAEWASAVRDARAAPPPRYRELRYESLMHDPVTEMAELFSWLDLPVDEHLSATIAEEAGVPVNIKVPKAHPISEGKWRSQLSAEDARQFEVEAGPLLRELGYPELPALRSSRGREAAPHAVRRLLRGLRRQIVKSDEPTQVDRLPPVHWSLASFADRVIELLESDQPDEIADLASTDVLVTVVDATGRQSTRGRAGVDLLLAELRDTSATRHKQAQADVHIQASGLTIVLSHLASDGTQTETVIVLELRMESAEPHIAGLVYYRLPLS
jgi:hypothetical protein